MPYGKIIFVCIIAMLVSHFTSYTQEINLYAGLIFAVSCGFAFARALDDNNRHQQLFVHIPIWPSHDSIAP